jgi:signal transduction histidine kinase/DNA-binding response OmpR family regulator
VDQPGARPKILVIDDTPETVILVQRLLSARYDVLGAEDGLQGIELATQARPDLVFVDLHMPQLTGYEVATRLKSLMPRVPIVALTADVIGDVRQRVLASGCDGYISKPIDPDQFEDQVKAYLAGEREELQDESYREAYQQALVARLEEKVRELTHALQRNAELNEQNLQLLNRAQRRSKLLEAGARVGWNITSILDLDALLNTTVDLICDEFGFYYSGVFLVDESGRWALLRAGRGEAGAAMLAEGHRLEVDAHSMIGAAISTCEARIALDVGEEPVHFHNPNLPLTRSEMALPLIVGSEVIGAVSVQSTEEAAFDDDDVAALQAMVDQLAVAINNARLLEDLEAAHAELMRNRTFEAIAGATGEAVHWVGNKAAPIPGSVARVTEDVVRYLSIANALLAAAPPGLCDHKFARMLALAAEELRGRGFQLDEIASELDRQPLERLSRVLDVGSILEDLEIIESGSRAILNIKEDLIGPARQRTMETILLPELLTGTVASMGLPPNVVRSLFGSDLLPVRADRVQLSRVFANLIKNAMEAMETIDDKKLFIWARLSDEPELVVVDVTDNGVGIPPEQIDRVWMPFYTTKGGRGGTGLGLPACAQIIGQVGGKIIVESDVGLGTTFSVFLPAATGETRAGVGARPAPEGAPRT